MVDFPAAPPGMKRGLTHQTYCAARLQTLDHGRPVSLYTVAQELGHESEGMVRRVYARLGKSRYRAEAPEAPDGAADSAK